jgi:cytochrome c oxidase cbb3-type subunit 1
VSEVAQFSRNREPERQAETTIDRANAGFILKFMVMSVIHLFIGTIQGVVQTFPGVAQWIRETGPAGHLIDPLAHAHINLVGGVTMGMMGLFYFVLPKLIDRPIYSTVLAHGSFWFSFIGVMGFFSSLVILGLIEGNMVQSGMTYGQALEAVGSIHHILIITFAFLMGFGYWAFITNILLTIFTKPRK